MDAHEPRPPDPNPFISTRPDPVRAAWARTWIAVVIAAIAMLVAVAATGHHPGSSFSSNSFEETPSTFDLTTPSTDYTGGTTPPSGLTASPADVTGTAGTWTLTATDDQGYSSQVTLNADTPVKASDAGSSSLGRGVIACSVNPDTDAVIPIGIEQENTTSSFSSMLGFDLDTSYAYGSDFGSLTLASDEQFTSGPNCDDASSGTSVYSMQWNDPVSAGGSASDAFYIVVHNYYSPANPDGDSSDLARITLSPAITFGDTKGTDGRHITDVSVTSTGSPPFSIIGTNS